MSANSNIRFQAPQAVRKRRTSSVRSDAELILLSPSERPSSQINSSPNSGDRKISRQAANDDAERKPKRATSPNIALYLGDCLKVMQALPGGSVDAIICDPPFCTTQCDWDREIDLAALWSEFYRIAKEDAPIVLFSAQPFTSKLIMSNIQGFRNTWYWEKEKGTNFFTTTYQPLRVIEEINVFSRNAKNTYNPQMVELEKPYTHSMPLKHSPVTGRGKISDTQDNGREYKTYTHSHPKNILKFARDPKPLIPTQKPLALLEYIVRTYTNRGDVVMDATMGSGTCGLACQNLGRSFIGIEKRRKHFNIAQARLKG